MELTLTGASLTSDKSSKSPRSRNASNDVKNFPVPLNAQAQENHPSLQYGNDCHHSHSHQHDKCCEQTQSNIPSNYRPVDSIPIDKLLAQPKQLYSAIQACIRAGPFETFSYLADAVIKYETDNDTTLDWGVHVDGVTCSLGRRTDDGHSLAHWAAKRADEPRFMEYLSKVPNINLHLPSTESVGMYPIHWACTVGGIRIVATILKHLNSISGDASHRTQITANLSTDILTEHKDPIHTRDKSGCTPLLIASQYGHADLAAFLIKRGADFNAVDDSRDTALHWAAYKGAQPVCGLLLHLGGIENHLDSADVFGQTPLHLASLRGNANVIEYLMEEAEGYVERDISQTNTTLLSSTHAESHVGSSSTKLTSFLSKSDSMNLPEYLLTLRDRDGKTPLDLAIKKKKTGCELILKEFMEKHCDHNQSFWYQLKKAIGSIFSIKNCKGWLGLTPERSTSKNSPKFIFWFVAINMLLGGITEWSIYVPLFGSAERGRLWDHTILHFFTMISYVVMWYSFVSVNGTNPGIIDVTGFEAMASASGTCDFFSFKKNCCRLNRGHSDMFLCTDENLRIKKQMEVLTRDLRNYYEENLERLAFESSDNELEQEQQQLGLCHSCHIAKPHRSKHCRVLNRCVLLFDHHCPFVGTTIGLYNYRYFYLYLLSFTTCEILLGTTWILHLRNGPGLKDDKVIFVLGFYLSLYVFMTGGLLFYHTQLIARNLTTNEHQNGFRYKYLRDENGHYFNPFDRGFFRNFMSRMVPDKDSYMIGYTMKNNHEKRVSMEKKHMNLDSEKEDLIVNVV